MSSICPRVEGSKARGQKLQVRGERFQRNIRGAFFTQGVARTWMELLDEAINEDIIMTFKRYLD